MLKWQKSHKLFFVKSLLKLFWKLFGILNLPYYSNFGFWLSPVFISYAKLLFDYDLRRSVLLMLVALFASAVPFVMLITHEVTSYGSVYFFLSFYLSFSPSFFLSLTSSTHPPTVTADSYCCTLSHSVTHTRARTHAQSLWPLWTRDRPVAADLNLTAHNTHKTQTSMPPAGIEPAVPAN